MGRTAWVIGVLCFALCGCSGSQSEQPKAENPVAVVGIPVVEKAQPPHKTGTLKRAMHNMTQADLIRLFVDEPAPEASPIIEAHQDVSFLSRLSPKEQVLYAELTH